MHSALTTRSAFHFAAFAGSFSCSFFASAEALTPVCAARKSSPSAREIGAKYCSASSDSIGSRLAGGRLPGDMERLITSGRLLHKSAHARAQPSHLLAKGNPIGRVRSRAARPRSSRTSHSVAPARYSRAWVGEHDHGELAMFGVGAHGSSPISFTKAQPKLQPALLRLSAMISQYFIGSLPFSS